MKSIVNGIAVEHEDEGEGPAIVLLHGWMNTLHSFDALVSELRGAYRIVRLDLPGFGLSETPNSPWHVRDYADFVRDFLEKRGIRPQTLVGHSFGGRVIIKGLATGSLKSERIVLIASAGNANRATVKNRLLWVFAKLGKAVTVVFPRSLQERLRRRFYGAIGSDYANAGALSEIFLNVTREDLSDDAARISVPVLLLWGSADATTSLRDGERLHACIQGSELHVFEGAGHALHRERAPEVAAAIRNFV